MSRFRMWLTGVIGLLALLILAVILVSLFDRLAGPPTPSQTITPTKWVSAATAILSPPGQTPPPYPPPASPTPPPPPPTPTFTPAPPSTPVTLPTGPLPPGLKIVCVDAADDGATALIWVANVDNLADKRQVVLLPTLSYRFWPDAWISPDGHRVAYLLPSKHWWENSVLGVVNLDGTGHTVLDAKVSGQGPYSVRWSSDSRYIAYRHLIPYEKEGTDKMELYVVGADGQDKRLLVKDAIAGYLVGWSKEGHTLYYIAGGILWQVDAADKAPTPVLIARLAGAGAWSISLSPDGTRFLYSTLERERSTRWLVNVLDIRTKELRSLAGPIESAEFAYLYYGPAPVWMADGASVAYSQPVSRDRAELRAIGLQVTASTLLKDTPGGYYEPLAWSPDGRFLAALWRGVTKAQWGEGESHLGLLSPDRKVQQVDSVNIYFVAPRFTPWFIGWIDDRKQ